jgi:hypothetical protein
VTLAFTVAVSIPEAHLSASTNFRKTPEVEGRLPRRGTMMSAIGQQEEAKDRGFLEEAPARQGG